MSLVTIGMPLYNNAATLAAAFDSLLAQTVKDLRIIASDHCSTDNTASICEAYARRDSRVEFVRQPKNLGYRHFRFVLDRADSPFFMWAAGDDRWAPTFIEKNLHALNGDKSLAASVSKVAFERAGNLLHAARGTYPLLGSVRANLARFLGNPSDNSRMYGLFRTEVLRKSFPSESFHAYDWALSAATLLHGKHNEVPEILMFRDWTPPPRYTSMVRKDHSSLITRLFPVLPMTRWLLFEARIPLTWHIAGALLALNIDKHYEYCESFHPNYFRWTATLQKLWRQHVRWRLLYPQTAMMDRES
jgi:glycosyltransferase involved in cell wall biosynthesis